MYRLPMWLWWTGAGVAAAVGGFVTWWSLFRDRARGRVRCPKCWYDMAGIAGGAEGWRCPECGKHIRKDRQLKRTRRRWRWALVGVLIVGVGVGVPVRRQVQQEGWLSMVPTRVLLWAAFSERFKSSEKVFSELCWHRFAQMGSGPRTSVTTLLLRELEIADSAQQSERAIILLAMIGGRDARITPALLRLLPSSGPATRVWIIRNFRNYWADPAQVVGPLTAIVGNPEEDPSVRTEAAWVLTEYGLLARGAEDALLRAMASSDPAVRYAAAWSAGKVTDHASVVVPRLRELLPNAPDPNDSDATSRWHTSVESLGHFPEATGVALNVFLSQLQVVSDQEGRRELLMAIARWGKAAASAEPRLKAIGADPNETEECVLLAEAAIEIIHGRQPGLAVALAVRMRDPTNPNPRVASRLLRRMRGGAGAAIALLLDEVDDGMDYDVMSDVCLTLSQEPDVDGTVLAHLRELDRRWPGGIAGVAIGIIERREWKGK